MRGSMLARMREGRERLPLLSGGGSGGVMVGGRLVPPQPPPAQQGQTRQSSDEEDQEADWEQTPPASRVRRRRPVGAPVHQAPAWPLAQQSQQPGRHVPRRRVRRHPLKPPAMRARGSSGLDERELRLSVYCVGERVDCELLLGRLEAGYVRRPPGPWTDVLWENAVHSYVYDEDEEGPPVPREIRPRRARSASSMPAIADDAYEPSGEDAPSRSPHRELAKSPRQQGVRQARASSRSPFRGVARDRPDGATRAPRSETIDSSASPPQLLRKQSTGFDGLPTMGLPHPDDDDRLPTNDERTSAQPVAFVSGRDPEKMPRFSPTEPSAGLGLALSSADEGPTDAVLGPPNPEDSQPTQPTQPAQPARGTASSSRGASSRTKHVFAFGFGCVVLWGFERREERAIVRGLLAEEVAVVLGATSAAERVEAHDTMTFLVEPNSDQTQEGLSCKNDVIRLGSDDPREKFALACAMAQSAKLFIWEARVDETINEVKHIPERLAATGRTDLTEKQISQMIGKVFIERTQVNLHSDILDSPDFLWENDVHEPAYNDLKDHLDVPDRVALLNDRLDVLRDLLEVLNTQLSNHHSSRLEIIVIWLIVAEILVSLLTFVFDRILPRNDTFFYPPVPAS